MIRALILAACALAFSGCAEFNEYRDLPYAPTGPLTAYRVPVCEKSLFGWYTQRVIIWSDRPPRGTPCEEGPVTEAVPWMPQPYSWTTVIIEIGGSRRHH